MKKQNPLYDNLYLCLFMTTTVEKIYTIFDYSPDHQIHFRVCLASVFFVRIFIFFLRLFFLFYLLNELASAK